jgi:hypothetical protein
VCRGKGGWWWKSSWRGRDRGGRDGRRMWGEVGRRTMLNLEGGGGRRRQGRGSLNLDRLLMRFGGKGMRGCEGCGIDAAQRTDRRTDGRERGGGTISMYALLSYTSDNRAESETY